MLCPSCYLFEYASLVFEKKADATCSILDEYWTKSAMPGQEAWLYTL